MGVPLTLGTITFKEWVKTEEPAEKERAVREIEHLEYYPLESKKGKKKMVNGTESFRKIWQLGQRLERAASVKEWGGQKPHCSKLRGKKISGSSFWEKRKT